MPDASVLSLVPTGGVAAVLVVVIFYLLRQNHADRTQYREHITRTEAEHADEIRAIEARHAEQMKRVEDELAKLTKKIEKTLADLDAERDKRWHAEDVAAQARRDLAALNGGQP